MTRAALWLRVSTERQDEDNQEPALRQLCDTRGWEVVKVYRLHGVSASNGEHAQHLKQMLEDAHRGLFDVVVIWAADRLTRRGIAELLTIVGELDHDGVQLVSHQETWLGATDGTRDLLLSIVGWVAEFESKRRSERIKAGLERRRARGLPVGGAVSKRGPDKRKRSSEPYKLAWQKRRQED